MQESVCCNVKTAEQAQRKQGNAEAEKRLNRVGKIILIDMSMKSKGKDRLADLFESFEMSKLESTHIVGGQASATNAGTCQCETAGSTLDCWVNTTSGGGDCGMDPDQVDADCA